MKKIIVLLIGMFTFLEAGILQDAIDKAQPGSVLKLPAGLYKGNIVIDKPISIIGDNRKSIIEGDANGTVVTITGTDVVLKNVHIRASGSMHQTLDAGIKVHDAKYITIENCLIDDCLFGIDLQQTHKSKVVNNEVYSKDEFPLGLRGDGVRLWYSNDNLVKKNRLIRSRDMVVWYSLGNIIEENYGEYCRYSLHFMYTGANIVRNNEYAHNSVGIFFMYSRDTIATGNIIKNSLGATGMGIGLKEASGFTIKDNTVIYCAQGFYVDWSPFEPGMRNLIENNNILYNAEGMHFHSVSLENDIHKNQFIGNIENVVNDTKRTDISKNVWLGNYWDDYEGFDKDMDGIGDTPYNHYYYADKMWLYNPAVKFFYASPVISIINFLAKLAPFSEPIFLLSDSKPMKNPRGDKSER